MACEQGSLYAAGWMYEHGEGTAQDLLTMVSNYQPAADQGYRDAIERMLVKER